MRELKFRAWDGKVKAFVYSEYNDDVFSMDGDMEHINQYIGLTDKNGVEIYEGDVLMLSGMKHVVKYYNGAFILYKFNNPHIYNIKWNIFEVIGNIYENPELLKGV